MMGTVVRCGKPKRTFASVESGEVLHEGGPTTDHRLSCDRLLDEVVAHRREDCCGLVLGDEVLVHQTKGEVLPPAASEVRSEERRYCDIAPKRAR